MMGHSTLFKGKLLLKFGQHFFLILQRKIERLLSLDFFSLSNDLSFGSTETKYIKPNTKTQNDIVIS